MASKRPRNVRRIQTLDQDRLITLLEKQGTEIRDQYMTIERIEEFYTEQCDSDQSFTIHTVPKEVTQGVEAALITTCLKRQVYNS